MHSNGILHTFLSALGRHPLAQREFPELTLRLQFETGQIEFPALIATCSLAPAEGLAGNFTAEFTATFTLVVPSEDYDDDAHAALIEETDGVLHAQILDVDVLNLCADRAAERVKFYSVEWSGTAEAEADADGRISHAWSFTGIAQL